MATDPFDDPRLTAMGLMAETHHGLAGRLGGVFRDHGISGSDFDVLLRLARSPDRSLRLTDLATQTSMSTSGITRVIDRLERTGLAHRAACPGDRRAYFVGLTEEGQRRLAEVVPALAAGIDRWFTGVLSPEQLAGFLDTLRTLRDTVHPGALAGAHECTELADSPPGGTPD